MSGHLAVHGCFPPALQHLESTSGLLVGAAARWEHSQNKNQPEGTEINRFLWSWRARAASQLCTSFLTVSVRELWAGGAGDAPLTALFSHGRFLSLSPMRRWALALSHQPGDHCPRAQANTVKDLPRHRMLLLPVALPAFLRCLDGKLKGLLSCLQLVSLFHSYLVCSKPSGLWLHEMGHTLWQGRGEQALVGLCRGQFQAASSGPAYLAVRLLFLQNLGRKLSACCSHTPITFIFYCVFF